MLKGLSTFVWFRAIALVFLISQASALLANEHPRMPSYTSEKIFLTPSKSTDSMLFNVRLAISESEHAFGLMYSPPLEPLNGMLFVFPDSQPRSFWMKNTPISLDMLFFNRNGILVAITASADPHSLTIQHSFEAAKYVLEIGGGEAERLKLSLGTRLELPIKKSGKPTFSR